MVNSEQCRREARQCRRRALQAHSPETEALYLGLAKTWDRVAEQVDELRQMQSAAGRTDVLNAFSTDGLRPQ